MSHLKQGVLRLPNGKSVKNINDYKLEMIHLRQQHVIQPVTPVTDSSQTSVKTVLYTHKNDLSHISHDTDPSHECISTRLVQHGSEPRINISFSINIIQSPTIFQ